MSRAGARAPGSRTRPGRDRRAVRHPGHPGAAEVSGRSAVVAGGGIAGVTAALALAERGVAVTLCEAADRLGGRVAAWPVGGGRTMSRGFHAFFRQYYNLRAVLDRIGLGPERLVALEDYPLQRPGGERESFAGLARTPPFSVIDFVRRSPAFTAAGLARVDVRAALELLQVRFPDTFSRYDGESAAAFLDRLQFPDGARDLALEVFARSFFADPTQFSAGELVAMFHTYFVGSAEGLLFDVPADDYHTTIWQPLHEHLRSLGVEVRLRTSVEAIVPAARSVRVHAGGETLHADALVLACDPRTSRELVAGLPAAAADLAGTGQVRDWQGRVAATRNAPPFCVLRQWLDRPVAGHRPAFLGTSGYGRLDNVSVLERFEAGAADWARSHRGSVVELHAYACPAEVAAAPETLVAELVSELHRVYPETAAAGVLHQEVVIRQDCSLITPDPWHRLPTVGTPLPGVVLAGDWIRCDYPVALMERAATTGLLAANALLRDFGGRGHDLWTVPMRGLLGRR